MVINETIFNVDCYSILIELQQQLKINKIPLLDTIKDGPDDVMICCPFHGNGQERNPSMGVRKSDGFCHCFACSTAVPLQKMISHCFGDESEIGAFGWNWLLKNFLTVSIEERKDIELDLVRNFGRVNTSGTVSTMHSCNSADSNGNRYVSEDELDSYRWTHPYWAKRRITNEKIIELFDLGYDPRTDCITLPVRDINGNTLFVARRSVKTKFFNYPRGVEKPLYGLYEFNKCICGGRGQTKLNITPFIMAEMGEVIVCESMIDALTAWQYGKYAVALNGTGTAFQFKQLRELPCRKLILATDADGPGMAARKRIRDNVKNKIITEYLWNLEDAKDLNDMSKEYFDNLKEVF